MASRKKEEFKPAIVDRLSIDFFEFVSRNMSWLRWVIVFACYFVAIAFGLITTKINPIFAVAASFAPGLIVISQAATKRFDLAPLIILLSALFIPFSLPTGTGSRIVFSLIVTLFFIGLWVLHSMTVEKRFIIQPFTVNKPIMGFSVVTMVSIVWSILFRDPFVFTPGTFLIVQIASGVVMVVLPLTMLLVGNFVNDLKLLKWMVVFMLFAGYLGLLKYLGGIKIPVDTEGLFSLWITCISFGLLIFKRNLAWYWRIALVVLIAGWIEWSFVINIHWLAGWLPGIIAFAVLSIMRSKKLALFLGLIFFMLIFWKKDYYFGKVLQNEDAESGNTRLAAWKANWSITRDHLLLGTGPAGYAVYYMSYFPTDAMATHSNYIDILSQLGIVGTVFTIWMFGSLTKMSFKLCKRLKGRGDFAEALANISFAGIIACIIIMGFGDWLFPFAYTQTIAGFNYAVYNWIFFGAVLVLDRLTVKA